MGIRLCYGAGIEELEKRAAKRQNVLHLTIDKPIATSSCEYRCANAPESYLYFAYNVIHLYKQLSLCASQYMNNDSTP
jgi:hypothetical protein